MWLAPETGERGERADLAATVRRDARRMAEHGRAVEVVDADWLRARYPQVRTADVAAAAVARDAALVDPEA
ncbi:MAG: sarcosine oxidase, partial [Halobacteriaceae archaeon]